MSKDSKTDSWNFKDDFWFDVTFVYSSSAANEVYLVGDFNGWKTSEVFKMVPRENGGFQMVVSLSEGYYHYKFLVDGEYKRDDKNPHVGGKMGNSVLFVHMDPNVYGIRDQVEPQRTYCRKNWQGKEMISLLLPVPPEIASFGILQRKIFVYLPLSYNDQPSKCYPVIYAHDGQNLFSTYDGLAWGGWFLDEKLDKWWADEVLPEFILVAIPNSDYVNIGNRQREYTSSNLLQFKDEPYVRYVTDVVKKEVDTKFRTLQGPSHTFTLGSSLGGLMAFLLSVTLPNTFSSAICLSPAFWFVDSQNESAFTLIKKLGKSKCRIYIDSGDGEGDNKEIVCDMATLMLEHNWKSNADFMYYYDKCKDSVPMGITHSECAWRERVIEGLKFALCKNT